MPAKQPSKPAFGTSSERVSFFNTIGRPLSAQFPAPSRPCSAKAGLVRRPASAPRLVSAATRQEMPEVYKVLSANNCHPWMCSNAKDSGKRPVSATRVRPHRPSSASSHWSPGPLPGDFKSEAEFEKERRKNPFHDFILDDPVLARVKAGRRLEDDHIKDGIRDLQHKAALDRHLSALNESLDRSLEVDPASSTVVRRGQRRNVPQEDCSAKETLQQLKESMDKSHRHLCRANPQEMREMMEQKMVKKNLLQSVQKVKKAASSGSFLSHWKKEFKQAEEEARAPGSSAFFAIKGNDAFLNRFQRTRLSCAVEAADADAALQSFLQGQGSYVTGSDMGLV